MNFFRGKAIAVQAFDQFLNSSLGGADLFSSRFQAAFGNDVGAGTMAKVEQAGVLKFRVGFGDSVGADYQFFGERADAWEGIAVAKHCGFDGVADLLYNL